MKLRTRLSNKMFGIINSTLQVGWYILGKTFHSDALKFTRTYVRRELIDFFSSGLDLILILNFCSLLIQFIRTYKWNLRIIKNIPLCPQYARMISSSLRQEFFYILQFFFFLILKFRRSLLMIAEIWVKNELSSWQIFGDFHVKNFFFFSILL